MQAPSEDGRGVLHHHHCQRGATLSARRGPLRVQVLNSDSAGEQNHLGNTFVSSELVKVPVEGAALLFVSMVSAELLRSVRVFQAPLSNDSHSI